MRISKRKLTKFDTKLQKAIIFVFNSLFFIVPLVLFPHTSEIFEFNKLIIIYLATLIISFLWSTRIILNKRLIFKKTPLDIPLLIFLISQSFSTIISINPTTSMFGNFGRFNGGLLSTISYSLLYWAYISNENNNIKTSINTFAIASFFVSLYAVLQRLGIDKSIWSQNVQLRVFSTLGQPNWLAAWTVAITPIVWSSIEESKQKYGHLFFALLSILLFLTLIFTKSRSGFIGFGIASGIYWTLKYFKKEPTNHRESKAHWVLRMPTNLRSITLSKLLLLNVLYVIIMYLFGTPWFVGALETNTVAPAFDKPRIENVEVRKLVWGGALKAFINKPLLGHGVETFSEIYPKYRPKKHNATREWNYTYNKAHNEYLNYLATTGLFGLMSYGLVIVGSVYIFSKTIRLGNSKYSIALVSGWLSILATNFFGFSVTSTSLIFFLFPALSITSIKITKPSIFTVNVKQKTILTLSVVIFSYLIFQIINYWYSDFLFAQGKLLNKNANYSHASDILERSLVNSPYKANVSSELAKSYSFLALKESEELNNINAQKWLLLSQNMSMAVSAKSPHSADLLQKQAANLIRLSLIENNLIYKAQEMLTKAINLSPTDPKLRYNLALIEIKLGKYNKALKTLDYTISLKENYRDPHFAKAQLLINAGKYVDAKRELVFILNFIDQTDTKSKTSLEKINEMF